MRYILLISCLLFSIAANAQDTITGTPTITDGDTIKIGKVKIRLHGIDAPERKQNCWNENGKYNCGTVATNFITKLINNKPVSCAKKGTDRYARVIAVCTNSTGQDINAEMVRNGKAIAYLYYSKDYEDEQNAAKANKVGIWAGRFVEPYRWRKGDR